MKGQHQPETNAPRPNQAAADDRLWELLDKGSRHAASPDFTRQVLDRLRAESTAPTPARTPWERLLAWWGDFVEPAYGRAGLAFALALALCITAAGVFYQQPQPQPANHALIDQPTPAPRPSDALLEEAPVELYSMQQDEVETILRLDDYLAFADQQAWLEPTATFLD